MRELDLFDIKAEPADTTALVVLSGGQDSVTCLGMALANHKTVLAISFQYGQQHEVELVCAAKICKDNGVPLKVVDLSFLGGMVTSALLGNNDDSVNEPHAYKEDLPASFVPNRNALFLTVAHAYAQEIGAYEIYTGVCQTDYSGYPDCREDFINSMAVALNVGYETDIIIWTPLMHLTKAETFTLAAEVGFLDVVIQDSHTCYLGDRTKFNDWGYGCGECAACELRAKGYAEFRGQIQ